jgi:hypothetical protein
MTSVTRFLKQIGPSNQFVPVSNLTTLSLFAWEFVPTQGQVGYVGDHASGYFIQASDALQAAIKNIQSLAQNPLAVLPVLRDMGKTNFAQVQIGGVLQPTAAAFRQVQLLLPQPISYPPGFIGGVNGNTFGMVGGSPDLYTPYMSFWIPITLTGGVFGSPIAGVF